MWVWVWVFGCGGGGGGGGGCLDVGLGLGVGGVLGVGQWYHSALPLSRRVTSDSRIQGSTDGQTDRAERMYEVRLDTLRLAGTQRATSGTSTGRKCRNDRICHPPCVTE